MESQRLANEAEEQKQRTELAQKQKQQQVCTFLCTISIVYLPWFLLYACPFMDVPFLSVMCTSFSCK